MMFIHATEAGLYANICDYLRHAYHCTKIGKPFRALWSSNSLYYDESRGTNAFEYFFKQPHSVEEAVAHVPGMLQGYIELPLKGEQFRIAMHQLQSLFLNYNETLRDMMYSVVSRTGVDKKTLGVHVRYTDKRVGYLFGEPSSAQVIDIGVYISAAQKAMSKFEFEKIFLATDDADVVSRFSEVFGSQLVTIDAPRSTGHEAIHSGMKHISGFVKGASVIADVELLSRCGYLIRSTSNVSSFAQFKNLGLKHLNLNEVLLGDNREAEFGLVSSDYEGLL